MRACSRSRRGGRRCAAGPDAAELLAELSRADLLVLAADRKSLTAALVSACDRFDVLIVPLCARQEDRRLAASFGLIAHEMDETAEQLLTTSTPAALSPDADVPAERGRVIAVWVRAARPGARRWRSSWPENSARSGRRVALVDADSHASSVAIAVGIADEGPGFAAACRQAERGGLTPAELTRISVPLGDVAVLTGLNRPGRWPELSSARVSAALEACRDWVDDVVVDIAAPLERDEEIVSDLDGPRRNAATLAVLGVADVVVAVVAADPVGVSRFVRAYPDLRAMAGAASVRVLVNKTRGGALGIDARGQLRRTLERFAGIDEVWFVPWDVKAVDAALLSARPVGTVNPRSALTAGVRRFVGEAIERPRPRHCAVSAVAGDCWHCGRTPRDSRPARSSVTSASSFARELRRGDG